MQDAEAVHQRSRDGTGTKVHLLFGMRIIVRIPKYTAEFRGVNCIFFAMQKNGTRLLRAFEARARDAPLAANRPVNGRNPR